MDITNLPKFFIRGTIAESGGMDALFGETVTSAADVRNFIEENKESKELVFEISSNGGYVSEGFEMYDLIKNCGKKITTIGYKVNSAAILPFLAGTKRYVSENVQFIIHTTRIDVSSAILTTEDLRMLAEDSAKSDQQIVDTYCKEVGEDKRSKILALMSVESDLGSKNAVKLGFAHGLWKANKEEKTKNEIIISASPFWDNRKELYQNILQNKFMENEKLKEQGTKIDTIFKSLRNLFKHKNEVSLELEDGTVLSVSGDGDLVGQPVLVVIDGLPTDPAPDGTHKLKDGRTITVAGGVITAVTEAENVMNLQNEIEALKAEKAALLAEKDALKNEKESIQTEFQNFKKETETQVSELKNQFDAFKKTVPGDSEEKKKDTRKELPKAKNAAEEVWNRQKLRMQTLHKK